MPEFGGSGTVTPDDFQRVRRLFEAALERTPAERGAFLDGACDGQPALRTAVERMLAADAQTHAFIDCEPPGRHAEGGDSPAVVCPSCGAALGASPKFCPECGSPLAADGVEGRFRAGHAARRPLPHRRRCSAAAAWARSTAPTT